MLGTHTRRLGYRAADIPGPRCQNGHHPGPGPPATLQPARRMALPRRPGPGAALATPSLDLKGQVRDSTIVERGREAHQAAPETSLHASKSSDCRWYGDAAAPKATTRRDQPSTIEEYGLMKSDHSMSALIKTNTNDMLIGTAMNQLLLQKQP